jgi:arylsulfatase A-like enzyme
MKAIMVMYDTLNRHFLPTYGNDWVIAPNFIRLAEKTAVFDRSFIGSFPTMPCRRELHTGRYNFLHRSWGPLEPFDDSMPEILRNAGIHNHLSTDDYHYFEDGSMNYHNRYRTWDGFRGQEGDFWKAIVDPPPAPESRAGRQGIMWDQDWVNRSYMKNEEDWPQAHSFKYGLEFIETNHKADNWFLQIETFDPHEPYFAPQQYRDLYLHEYTGQSFDWNGYCTTEGYTKAEIDHLRYEYAALLSFCDACLGKVLDAMDQYNLWQDTMLIVNTDHGHLLGEHSWMGKGVMPLYNEIALTPLFIWDPRSGKKAERNTCLVQAIDWAPTLLEYFGQGIPPDMLGKPLKKVIEKGVPVREAGLFGSHGGYMNCTDGRYVYMRCAKDKANYPRFNYTLMPTHMRGFFNQDELGDLQLAEPFSFTKGFRTLKTPLKGGWGDPMKYGNLLFDLDNDHGQETPLDDKKVEKRMIDLMVKVMEENDAPVEQYERLGLKN